MYKQFFRENATLFFFGGGGGYFTTMYDLHITPHKSHILVSLTVKYFNKHMCDFIPHNPESQDINLIIFICFQ